jgi:urease gamma subunit
MADGEALSAAWHGMWSDVKEAALSASVSILSAIGEIEHRGIAEFNQLADGAKAAFARITGDAQEAAKAVAASLDAQKNELMRRENLAVRDGKSPFGELNLNAFGPPAARKPDSDAPTIKGLYDTGDDGSSKSGSDATSAAMKASEDEIQAAQRTLRAREQLYAEGAKIGILSDQQKLAASKSALDEEYNAEKALLQKELTIDGLKLAQKQAINDKLKALDQKYAADSEKLFMQSVENQIQAWDNMVNTISGSFSSGIMGMIRGTETFRQMMLHVAGAITQQFVKLGVDLVANWAKTQIAQVVLSQSAEGQKTAAALAGAAARGGIASGEAMSGIASIIANAIKSITIDSGVAGAGAAAFSAPFIGPAAVAEGAAVKGAVMSMAAFDIGAWQIDQDQVAMVHRNEMVMPAAEAGAFRSMLSGAAQGGGVGAGAAAAGGDTHVHLNVSALDAHSVKNWLSNNSGQIMKAMNQAVRNGDHLGLRRLATT